MPTKQIPELLIEDPCAAGPPLAAWPQADRIRVLELLASGTGGGAQEHVRTLVNALPANRYQVSVAALSDGRALRQIKGDGLTTHLLSAASDDQAIEALIELLERERPQVVHAHMFRAELIAARAIARQDRAGRPRPRLLATIHSSRVRSAADQAALIELDSYFDGLIAVSEAMVVKLAAEGRDQVPVELIYNGIDLARFGPRPALEQARLRADLGYQESDRLVGAVGRLEPEKGHEVLLAAWPAITARHREARLLLIGEGSARAALEAQTASLGAPAQTVRFLGWRADVAALTGILEVAVLPSHREALGLAVIEALASGRPMVASAVGGVPELIKDGQTGLLVPPGDSHTLAAAVIALLDDPGYAASLGITGQRLVHERFCLQLMVRRLSRLYDQTARTAGWRAPAEA